jgi:hypothetical protein
LLSLSTIYPAARQTKPRVIEDEVHSAVASERLLWQYTKREKASRRKFLSQTTKPTPHFRNRRLCYVALLYCETGKQTLKKSLPRHQRFVTYSLANSNAQTGCSGVAWDREAGYRQPGSRQVVSRNEVFTGRGDGIASRVPCSC